eukprot:3781521-Rhodomonas_salina.12
MHLYAPGRDDGKDASGAKDRLRNHVDALPGTMRMCGGPAAQDLHVLVVIHVDRDPEPRSLLSAALASEPRCNQYRLSACTCGSGPESWRPTGVDGPSTDPGACRFKLSERPSDGDLVGVRLLALSTLQVSSGHYMPCAMQNFKVNKEVDACRQAAACPTPPLPETRRVGSAPPCMSYYPHGTSIVEFSTWKEKSTCLRIARRPAHLDALAVHLNGTAARPRRGGDVFEGLDH